MLIRLFSSQTRIDLLTAFFTHPEKRYYTRQLARELRRDISGIKRELDNLEKAGLLISEKVGNLRYYTPSKTSPIYSELKRMIAKTRGVPEAIREALLKIEGVNLAFLYSSPGHSFEEGVGAVELLIVGQVDLPGVNQAIREVESRLAREINYLIFDESEYRRRKDEEDPFLHAVLKSEKIFLIGRDDDL